MDDRKRRRDGTRDQTGDYAPDHARELEAMIDAVFAEPAPSTPATSLSVAATPRAVERRTILVDGFNVLHATLDAEARERGWWRRVWREDLLRRVASWPVADDRIWVAFDGASPSWSCWAEPVAKPIGDARSASGSESEARVGPHVHSLYVESADDWIVRRARRAERPATTIVVSRDRQVAGRARSAGCEVWSPGTFLARCPPPPQPEPTG